MNSELDEQREVRSGTLDEQAYYLFRMIRANAREMRDKQIAPKAGYTKQVAMRYLRQHGYDMRSNYALTRMVLLLLDLCITYEIGAIASGEEQAAQASVVEVGREH